MSTQWEQGLIGTLIVDQETVGEFLDVAPADLAAQQHRQIYIQAVHLAKNKGLSAKTLIGVLDTTGVLENIGDESGCRGADYIYKLSSMGDPLTAGEFRKQVLNESDLRKLQELGSYLLSAARTGAKTAQELLQEHVQSILKVQRNTREPRLIGSLIPAFDQREHKILSGDSIPFWEPPIGAIREVLPHLEDVDFMLIAGQPGTGKSSLVRALGLMTAQRGKAVLAMPFENSEEEYLSWAIAQIARVDHYHVVDPRKKNEDEERKVASAKQQLETLPYYIYGMGIANINELVASIKSFIVKHPETGLIIVDGIYLIGGKDSAYENISNNTQVLRSLAQDLHIPVIGTTQFKRLQKEGGKKKAELDSLLYAGENASRIVLAIEKKELTPGEIKLFAENKGPDGRWMLTENLNTVVVQAHVLKNTNGRTGWSGEMAWRKPFNCFDSLPRDWRGERVSFDDLANGRTNGNGHHPEPAPAAGSGYRGPISKQDQLEDNDRKRDKKRGHTNRLLD